MGKSSTGQAFQASFAKELQKSMALAGYPPSEITVICGVSSQTDVTIIDKSKPKPPLVNIENKEVFDFDNQDSKETESLNLLKKLHPEIKDWTNKIAFFVNTKKSKTDNIMVFCIKSASKDGEEPSQADPKKWWYIDKTEYEANHTKLFDTATEQICKLVKQKEKTPAEQKQLKNLINQKVTELAKKYNLTTEECNHLKNAMLDPFNRDWKSGGWKYIGDLARPLCILDKSLTIKYDGQDSTNTHKKVQSLVDHLAEILKSKGITKDCPKAVNELNKSLSQDMQQAMKQFYQSKLIDSKSNSKEK